MNSDPVQKPAPDEGRNLREVVGPILKHWRLLISGALVAVGLGFGASYLVEPTFTARTTLLPPERPQSGSSMTLQTLGALAGIGALGGTKTTTDQFAALLQSVTVQDRLIDEFGLLRVYDKKYRADARRELGKRVHVTVGKKDGLMTIEVDDSDPDRAAALANSHVAELRRLTSVLAVTEAQQRRIFFEAQLRTAQQKLDAAQRALEGSGINRGAINAEPRAAADAYARLRSEIATAQVRLRTLRGTMADSAVEVQTQQAMVTALESQLARLEQSDGAQGVSDYVSKYREFKYRETVVEMMARNYELARVDESREGALIQVVDIATKPEKRSSPHRAYYAGGGLAAWALLLVAWGWLRSGLPRERSSGRPDSPQPQLSTTD